MIYMAFTKCNIKKNEDKKENDLYEIWMTGKWTAPRDGTVKAVVFVTGHYNSINDCIATCTCFGITATSATYSSNSTAQNSIIGKNIGAVNVKKGQVYSAITTAKGVAIRSYGAYFTYID